MTLNGILPALCTPFDDRGAVDLSAMSAHVDRLIGAGVSGFFVCGTTGEGALLKPEEKRQLIGAVLDRVGSALPVVAAVIQPDTANALAEVEAHVQAGASLLAVVAPYYVRVDEKELIEHFVSIADTAPCPVLLYDIPQNTANPVTDAVYDAVLSHDNVIGVKDSSGNFARFSRRVIAARHGDGSDVSWIQGDDALDAAALFIGADGFVSGLANIMAEPFVAMIRAREENDSAMILRMQQVVDTIYRIIPTTGRVVASIRAAVALRFGGSRRLKSETLTLSDRWDGTIREILDRAMELYESA